MKEKIQIAKKTSNKLFATIIKFAIGLSMLCGAAFIVMFVIECDTIRNNAFLFYGSLAPAAVLIVTVFGYTGWLIHKMD